MGQFKPMVKMMTTEPTVELKLKKGGHVSMKGKGEHGHKSMPHMMDGGTTPAMSSMMPARGGMAPVGRPARPPLSARRRAMAVPPMASPAPATMMKKGGKAEGGESKAEHKAEMKAIKGVEKELKSHESKSASRAHKGLKTGGVVMGQSGYKKGGAISKSGIIPESVSARGGEGYKNTKMHTDEHLDKVPAKTGEVKLNKAAGYKDGGSVMKYVEGNVVGTPPGKSNTKTGGVKLGNAGGYKKGGSAKKYARGGAVNDSGNVKKMAQGQKKPSAPVSITALSGTFKKGGKVAKMAGGGDTEDLSKGAYDRFYSDQKKENEAMRDTILGAPGRAIKRIKGFFGGAGNKPDIPAGSGSVTETEKSVTVSPAKKRGGAVKC